MLTRFSVTGITYYLLSIQWSSSSASTFYVKVFFSISHSGALGQCVIECVQVPPLTDPSIFDPVIMSRRKPGDHVTPRQILLPEVRHVAKPISPGGYISPLFWNFLESFRASEVTFKSGISRTQSRISLKIMPHRVMARTNFARNGDRSHKTPGGNVAIFARTGCERSQ